VQKINSPTITITWLLSTITYALTNLAQAAPSYGPVQTGTMLWDIVAQVAPSSDKVNRYQVIVALHKVNPHAFKVPCNMNSLKVGEYLNVPPLAVIQQVTSKEARQEYNRQLDEWKNRRQTSIICSNTETAKATTTTETSATSPGTGETATPSPTTVTAMANPSLTANPTPTDKPVGMEASTNANPTLPTEATATNDSTSQPTTATATPEPPTAQPTEQPVNAQETQPTPTAVTTVTNIPTTLIAANETTEPVNNQPVSDSNNVTPESQQPSSAPFLIVASTILGLMLTLLIIWLLRRHGEKQAQAQEASEKYTFAEPFDDMPLPMNYSAKNLTNSPTQA
jgi:FimV-like protein